MIIFGFLLGPQRLIRNDLRANMMDGYLTSKIICLVETLLEYRFCQLHHTNILELPMFRIFLIILCLKFFYSFL